MDSSWLRIDEAALAIQDLILEVGGRVQNWDSEVINVDLEMNAPSAEVASFWSLLPKSLTKDLEGLESQGMFEVAATLEGELSEGSLPLLQARLDVRDGSVSYPNLPSSITDINLDASISNDKLTVRQLQARADGAQLDVSAEITEFNAPQVESTIALEADMSRLDTYYPLGDSTTLSGLLRVNTTISGPLGQAADVNASGVIELNAINYSSPSVEQPIEELSGRIIAENEHLVFDNITLNTGQSDVLIQGTLANYTAFLTDTLSAGDEPTLEGTITSDFLNITEQISQDTTSSFVGPLELPPVNLNVSLNARELEFNGFLLSDATGRLTMTDQVIGFEQLSARFLNGELSAAGDFNLTDPALPAFNGTVSLKQLPVSEFFSSFSGFDSIVQLGSYLDGLFDSEASIGLKLDKDLNPDYASIIANGVFGTKEGSFGTTPLQSAVSDYFGISEMKSLAVRDWAQAFRISGEQLHVQDLSITAGDYSFSINGSQGFDGTLDYNLSVELPESASNKLSNAPVQGALGPIVNVVNTSVTNPETGRITLDLLAGGTFSEPSVSLNSDMMRARLTGQASSLAAAARAEAQARIDSLEQAARDRAEAEVEEQREVLENRAKDEANKLLGGVLDSTATDIDSLKDKGADALKNRLDGLFNRKKRKN